MRVKRYLAALITFGALMSGCEVTVESNIPLEKEDASQGVDDKDTSSDKPDTNTPDTSVTDSGDTSDANEDADSSMTREEMVARGDYLVNHVAICVDCHSPRTETGELNHEMLLAGNDCFVDYSGDPTDGVGCVSALNLTNHETGLKRYTDEQVFELLRTGATMHENEKRVLLPLMPYWSFANMTDNDLRSIITYLRTLPPIDNLPAPNEPLPGEFAIIEQRTEPALPISMDEYPESTLQPGDQGYEQAQRGKYLVAAAGCVDCHSPETTPPQDDPNSDWIPADRDMLLQGGRTFHLGFISSTSTNLTPHETGIWDYSPEEIRIAIKAGNDSDGRQMCPPMPGGPESPYGGMTDEDALAIGWYLTTIPPMENSISECNP